MSESESKRLFIGLSLSDTQRETIDPIVKKLKATSDRKEIQMRWSPKANWHVTLAFLGLTTNSRISELKNILKTFASQQSPLQIHLRHLGGFPDVRGARVLWVGVAATKRLLELQKNLEEELVPWGHKSEDGYSPHLTVARLRNQKNIADLISPWVRKDFGKIEVKEITLFESRPAGYFSAYVPIESFLLSRENTVALEALGEGNS